MAVGWVGIHAALPSKVPETPDMRVNFSIIMLRDVFNGFMKKNISEKCFRLLSDVSQTNLKHIVTMLLGLYEYFLTCFSL